MSTDCAHKSPRALLGSSPPPTVAQWTDGRSGWWGAPPLDLSYYGSTELTPQVSPDSFLEILTYQLPRFSGAPSIITHLCKAQASLSLRCRERCPPALLLPIASALWPSGSGREGRLQFLCDFVLVLVGIAVQAGHLVWTRV
jgi:hypothetical protein